MHAADQVLTAAQMRAAEQVLIDRGAPVEELMLRAGRGAADWVYRVAVGRPVTVLCGPGNNGGDGYVIAQTLAERGLTVRVIAAGEPATPAARMARAAWRGETPDAPPARGGVFVDCLFGSGLSRPLSAQHAVLLADLVSGHEAAIAIDLPSGVATDTGALLGQVPRFDLTLALGAWKPAHYLMPALGHIGAPRIVDIGIEGVADAARVSSPPCLSAPGRGSHKYSRGLVGVVAGAMPGAAVLCAGAAMRAGAGYVKVLAPEDWPNAAAALVIERASLGEGLRDKRWSALVVGPGLGRGEVARERLEAAIERGLPTVLDADALHLLDDDLLEGADPSRLLLTPHDGELAQLCVTFGIEGTGKLERTVGLSEMTGLTVLAKGPDTVLAAPGRPLTLFPPASAWLASAGTGDVLAGIAASRLATGMDPFMAANEAYWLHAEAARIAGAGLIADDLVEAIPDVYGRFL